MSVSTPILTTSSETWASAAVDASIAAARIPSLDRFLANILSPPWNPARWPAFFAGGWSRRLVSFATVLGRRQRGRREGCPGTVIRSVYFRCDSGHRRAMTSPQRLPNSLTPLDQALDALLQGVEPV